MSKLEFNDIRELALQVAKADKKAPVAYNYKDKAFSYKAMNDTLREALNDYSRDPLVFEQYKYQHYALIREVLDEILPARVIERYGDFAEFRQYAFGDRPIFTQRLGRMRAKQFVTRVGDAGRYEVWKLSDTNFEVTTNAIGTAVQVGYEEFLDGRVDFAEMIEIVMDGMDEMIYREIGKALQDSINQLPNANKATSNGFDEALMDRLISVVSAYGSPTIYCYREFATKIVPAENWVSNNMKDEYWRTGHLANYKGVPIVILPQSFEDETNAKKVFDPGYVWVMPSGSEKPVKVAFEGGLQVNDIQGAANADWSRDIHCYQKVGVAVLMTNNIGSYIDTSLKGKLNTVA